MTVFTPITEQDVSRLCREAKALGFDLGEGEIHITETHGSGVSDSTYIIGVGEKTFILKLLEGKDPLVRTSALDNTVLVSALHQAGAPVAGVLPHVFDVKGKQAVVSEFIQGVMVSDPCHVEAVARGAEALAHFHTIGNTLLESGAIKAPERYGSITAGMVAANIWPLLRSLLNPEHPLGLTHLMAFSHVATDILAHLTGKGREGYPEGLIHGDIGLRNIIFTPEGEATFIDFEKIRQGPLVYDVAYYIYYSCQSAEGEWHAPSISAALEAYESIRPLEPKEREALGSWITYIAGYIHFGMVYFAMNETTPSQVGGEEFMHLDKTAQRLQAVYAEPLKQVLEEYNRAAEQRQAQSAQP